MRNSDANTAVALVQARELGRHLRDALTSMGTPIVYEAAPRELDLAALESSGARVVVVNLDPEVEEALDEVYGLLEDDRYCVVFNDASASSSLSGWDQARWARHLASKIIGDANIDPPRPAGAEAVPAPRPVAEHAAPAAEVIELASDNEADEIELAAAPQAGYDDRLQSLLANASELSAHETPNAADPRELLDSRYDDMHKPATADFPTPQPPTDDGFDFSTLEALTAAPTPPTEPEAEDVAPAFSPAFEDVTPPSALAAFEAEAKEFDDIPSAPIAVASSSVEEAVEEPIAESDLAGFDLDALDKLFDTPEKPTPDVPAEPFAIDVGDLGADDSEIVLPPKAYEEPAEAVKVPDISRFSLEDIDEGEEETSLLKVKPAESSLLPPSMVNLAAAADWSLEDMLAGDAPAAPPPTGRADFGIEKVAAAEYLAPSEENTAPPPEPEGDFSLELMPLEEAVAPQAVEREPVEAWLDPDKVKVPAKINRVYVLGASIGGPEAVRDFLSELPRGYPALFLLAQHMGAEFVDLMAQQLAKATPLTVRTPTHGERVSHGDVVIVPTTHRLQVDVDGIVLLERVNNDGAYSPSIDRVLRDVADRYGAAASAIIFSGMTTDAVDGAKYLASKGGAVYAQHPDTCVVSSMIDGVVEAGIVKVLGAPKELAGIVNAQAQPPSKPKR
ncbi:MAG TPA: chemotaxis protein CheB [Rhodanobacteraceae bacterium]|nr:chemotaxis protein CheB [Rhodanobacteraceae bacterium]